MDNTYDNTMGLLTKSTYGNGYALTYVYDEMDRLKEVKNGSTVLYRYHYDADGRLREAEDAALGVRTQYDYDLEGKLAWNLSNGMELSVTSGQ